MATYLGRNVNLALLVIIIGVVVALVGTTVFFQRSLQNRTGEYETTSFTLSQCQTALSNYQDQFSKAQAKVNQTSQDIKRYDQLYEQKSGELKDTQSNLSATTKQMLFERLQKEKFKEFYEGELKLNLQLNATVRSQTTAIAKLQTQLNSCQNKLDICEDG